MNTNQIPSSQGLIKSQSAKAALRKGTDSFKDQLLAEAKQIKSQKIENLVDEKAEETKKVIGQLVASTFIKPMLDEMRNSPFKNEMFSGGQGEKVFGSQLDSIIAERVTSSSDNSLVASIYSRLEKQVRVIERQRAMNQMNNNSNGKVRRVG